MLLGVLVNDEPQNKKYPMPLTTSTNYNVEVYFLFYFPKEYPMPLTTSNNYNVEVCSFP